MQSSLDKKKATIVVVASHPAWSHRQGMVDTFCQVLGTLVKRRGTDVSVILVNGDRAEILCDHAQRDPESVARRITSVHPRGHTVLAEAKALALRMLPESGFSGELFIISNGKPVDDTTDVDRKIMHRVNNGVLKVHTLLYGSSYTEPDCHPQIQHGWVDGDYVAIDGANVCGWSTRKSCPNLYQLLAVSRKFRMSGVEYTAWFDASFKHCLAKYDPAAGKLFGALLATRPDRFKEVPAGFLNGQPIKADTFVLNDAIAHDGWYLANDLYRREANDNPVRYGWVRDSSDKRLVGQVSGNYIFIEPIGWKIEIDNKVIR